MADAASPASSPMDGKPALDEVMLAMDLVDTLRHAERLVERELSADERDRQMKDRLRQIYATQGIEVTDEVLEEGVKALREERFAYSPAKPGLGRSLAMLWISRGRWGKLVGIALIAIAVLGAGYWFGVRLPEERRIAGEASELAETLPRALAAERDRILAIAHVDRAKAAAEQVYVEGAAAVKAGDAAEARGKLATMQALRKLLETAYAVRVVSRPGERSGVFRIPDANSSARNYYLIVEAIDSTGKPVPVPITSEEDNRTDIVSTWGVRVDAATYNRVAADKQDDGIIQNNRIGEKRPGDLAPEYTVPVTGAILKW